METKEKKLDSTTIFEGKIFTVYKDTVELPDGRKSHREVTRHKGAVCVAALTKDDELLFVRQYRYPYGEVLLEIPAGRMEDYGTEAENAARELREETGAIGDGYIYLGKLYPSPGYCDEVIHMYFCNVDHFEEQQLDDGEFLNVERISLQKAFDMVMNNKIYDSKTQTAVLKAYYHVNNSK